MITALIKKYLSDNEELEALLGATADDSKIYFATAPRKNPLPKIVFWSTSPENAGDTGVIFTQIYTFEIYTKTKTEQQKIQGLLIDLLNNFDEAQEQIGGDDNRLLIKESHMVSSFSSQNFELDTHNNLLETLSFQFKYTRCK